MIPSTWLPHFRGSDGELVGYLDGADPTVVPRTLFGYALGDAGPAVDAGRLLEQRGLACLQDRWELTLESGEQVPVLIMSAYADRVVVAEAPYGIVAPGSRRHTLRAPTGDRLVLPG